MRKRIMVAILASCVVTAWIVFAIAYPWNGDVKSATSGEQGPAVQQQKARDESSSGSDSLEDEPGSENEVPAWDEFVGTEEEYLDAVASAMPRRDKQLNEYEIVYPEEGLPYRKQLVDVAFYKEIGKERAQEIVEEVGLDGRWICDSFALPLNHSTCIVNLEYPESADVLAIARMFETFPEVASAGVSLVGDGNANASVPNDSYVADQYYLDASKFTDAWNTATCDGRTTIAVLDTGIDMDHPDLVCNIDYASAFDAWNNVRIPVPLDTTEVDPGYEDMSHGSMVAGVASARANNEIGVAGSSYNARILPIRITDDGINPDGTKDQGFEWEYLRNAGWWLEALPSKPDVVNMSFAFNYARSPYTDDVQESISNLHEQGVVFIAAAGNHNSSEDVWPAAFNNVIGVGALSKSGSSRWEDASSGYGSAFNQHVDICAPGENILTTQNLTFSSRRTGAIEIGYWADSGTSLSAPQVAAVAALIKRAHPGYTVGDIEKALFETTVHPADFVDEVNEEGQPNPDGKDDLGRYGYGALDAAAAVLWSDQKNPDPSKPSTGGAWSPTAGGNLAEIYHAEKTGK